MNEFTIVVEINRPVAEVFDFVEKIENVPQYNAAVREAHMTSTGPIGIGSTAVMTGRFLGRDWDTSWEVVDYKHGEMVCSRTTSGQFDMQVTYTFEPAAGGGARVTQHVEADSRGFFKLAESVVTRISRKQFEAAAETMKELLEAGADR